ncbi:Uncharacterised protein [Mycobacteroides abscessus subsp. abscessus]|nr:Uncharacterised protein [Mycobacteroides abscessus subsp. abscessus]
MLWYGRPSYPGGGPGGTGGGGAASAPGARKIPAPRTAASNPAPLPIRDVMCAAIPV